MDSLPFDPKLLKKIADECRKAGVTRFKGFGFELEIAAEAPPSAYKLKKAAAAKNSPPAQHAGPDEPEVEGLSEDDMLFWSVGDGGMELAVTPKAAK